ncbi:MAG: hypothetical protein IIX97_05070 [Clostridia bacterium]|nr:hypothetical protein [Clostridia bacterium]
MDQKILAKDTYTVKTGKIRSADILLFCIAPFFIFNPEMALMDVIPDFIGYVLMLIPLFKLRDVNDRFDDARKQTWIALLINVGKYAALFLSFGAIGQKEGGAASSIMMFSLVFAVLDIIFTASAFRALFDALGKVGERSGSLSVIGHAEKKRRGLTVSSKKNRTEKIASSTFIFIIVRALCFALPEFSTGSSHGFDETVFDWARFTALFRTFGAIIALVCGIVWLCRSVAYFTRVARDREFISYLDQAYQSCAQSNKAKFILRNVGVFTTIASAVLFLCGDIYVIMGDIYGRNISVNVLPDTLAALLLVLGFALSYSLFKADKKIKLTVLVPTLVWTLTSLIKDMLRYFFFGKYTMYVYERDPDAYSLYSAYQIACVIDAIAFCAVVFAICAVINYINNGYAVSKLSRENESLLRMKEAEREEYRRSYVLPVKCMAVVSAICSALYPYVMTLTTMKIPDVVEKYKSPEYMLVNFAGAYWAIDLAVTLVLAFLLRRAMSALKDRAENNLMLE